MTRPWKKLRRQGANGYRKAVERLLTLHHSGCTTDDITETLTREGFLLSTGSSWDSRSVWRAVVRRGLVPNDVRIAADWENDEFDRERERAAYRNEQALRLEQRRLDRNREALNRAGRQLDQVIRRHIRVQAHQASELRHRFRRLQVAQRRAVIGEEQARIEVAKAAHARAALQSRGDDFLRSAGPVVMAMLRHNRSFSQIAVELTARGIRTARGGPWTPPAASSVWARLRVRLADPAFQMAPLSNLAGETE